MLRDAERAKVDVVTCFKPALRVAGDVRTILSFRKKTPGNGPMLGNAIASPPERHVIHRLVAALKTRRPGEPHPYVVGPTLCRDTSPRSTNARKTELRS